MPSVFLYTDQAIRMVTWSCTCPWPVAPSLEHTSLLDIIRFIIIPTICANGNRTIYDVVYYKVVRVRQAILGYQAALIPDKTDVWYPNMLINTIRKTQFDNTCNLIESAHASTRCSAGLWSAAFGNKKTGDHRSPLKRRRYGRFTEVPTHSR